MAVSVSSALVLLLNMAATLLAPFAPAKLPNPNQESADGDVEFFFFPFLVQYKSGRVHRFTGTDTVPAATDPATGVASRDVTIDPATGLWARLYLPNRTSDRLPLVVFYHGGAFVTESASSPTYHRYLNALASKSGGALVVSVDYRLAPEHPVPAAYADAWAALGWAVRNARAAAAGGPDADPWLARHADPARVFLVGDSAGGNVAHNMAMRAGMEEGLLGGAGPTTAAMIRGVALLDPYFWGKRPVPAETRDAETRRWKELTWEFVCAGRYGVDDPVLNPVAMAPAEWRRLAGSRVLVTVAGMDVLSARGRAYARALSASGWQGEVELYETVGEDHVYFLMKPESEKAVKEMQAVVEFIHRDEQVMSTPSRMDA